LGPFLAAEYKGEFPFQGRALSLNFLQVDDADAFTKTLARLKLAAPEHKGGHWLGNERSQTEVHVPNALSREEFFGDDLPTDLTGTLPERMRNKYTPKRESLREVPTPTQLTPANHSRPVSADQGESQENISTTFFAANSNSKFKKGDEYTRPTDSSGVELPSRRSRSSWQEYSPQYGKKGLELGCADGGIDPEALFAQMMGGDNAFAEMFGAGNSNETTSFRETIACPACHSTCTGCNGAGMKTMMSQWGPGLQCFTTVCLDCEGRGEPIRHKYQCDLCLGERMLKRNEPPE
jgi:hypothetical protein